MKLYLQNDLKRYFSDTTPLFDQIMSLQGQCFREQKGRLTQRILLGDKYYFLKTHTEIGWKEILKNILQGRWPVLSAKDEWRAIEKLQAIGVHVPIVVGYGERYVNPAKRESFILMEELAPTCSLEELGKKWRVLPPAFAHKRKLILEVARIARDMHAAGINHRDFYICHFLLDNDNVIYLIDLHRAQIRKKVPVRWRVKDLAGLYFSSKDIGLTKRDYLRFMKVYSNQSLRELKQSSTYWENVKERGEKLYRDHQK